jgi:hypothetical protein
MVVVENFLALGENARRHIPDPVGAIGHERGAQAIAGKPGRYDLHGRRQVRLLSDLTPARDMDHAMILAQRIDPKPPSPGAACRAAFGLAPAR